jgi:hypothetical protein
MHTNKFKPSDPCYANQATVRLAATSDTFELVACATRAARRIWRDGFSYSKAGIVLLDLSPAKSMPSQLIAVRNENKSAALMEALDEVNMRYGRSTLHSGKLPTTPPWGMRRSKLSPSFTTNAEDMHGHVLSVLFSSARCGAICAPITRRGPSSCGGLHRISGDGPPGAAAGEAGWRGYLPKFVIAARGVTCRQR